MKLWASWNGATTVSAWRILSGPSPSSLRTIGTEPRTAFETTMSADDSNPYFAVQALGSKGQVLSTSNTVTIGAPRVSPTRSHDQRPTRPIRTEAWDVAMSHMTNVPRFS